MSLDKFYDYFWNPSLYCLAGMEYTGIALDQERLRQASNRCASDIDRENGALASWTNDYCRQLGEPINWNSPKQKATFLYNYKRFQIPEICGGLNAKRKNIERKPTTDAASLEWIANQPTTSDSDRTQLKRLLRLSKASKLQQFMQALPLHVKASTGRLHCVLAPETETGRLSSRNPNLQNIPARADVYGIRKAFVPSPGYVFIVADYSQLELYVLAHFLIELFNDHSLADALQSEDIHTEIARRCWPEEIGNATASDVKADEGMSRLRGAAKNIIYGINYGKTAGGLAVQLGISKQEAQAFLDAVLDGYPGIKAFQEHCVSTAKQFGRVYTLLGRHRDLPGLQSEEDWKVRASKRRAFNTPIQGSAADIVTAAMLNLNTVPMLDLRERGYYNAELAKLGSRTCLQIHDEFILEVPESEVERALPLAVQAMENPFRKLKLNVPLSVSAEIGCSWGDCK